MIRSNSGSGAFEERVKQRIEIREKDELQETLRKKVTEDSRRSAAPDLHMQLIKEKAEKAPGVDSDASGERRTREAVGYDAAGEVRSPLSQSSGQLINLEV
ncbi:MAG: hypothetical protein VYA34_04695 [Myxococcota bacterium]|nr:hypothetical protein [Myxococcota bacterium]